MSHALDHLFEPSSIAVIGASERPHAVGTKVFQNLVNAGFQGKLFPVNPKHTQVAKHKCYGNVTEIPGRVDLAVIATPAASIPTIIKSCGEKKIPAAIILSSGFSESGKKGKEQEAAVLAIAKEYGIRLIGPNCLGVMRPRIGMNATFDNNFAISDGLALVSQSGAISAAILDWALPKKIGFSTLVSLGNSMDVGFGEVLEFLAADPHTKSILLYIEGIHHAQKFMHGLQAAAKVKPVIVIKAGKNQQGSRAALSHTGAIIGDDDVFDAALARAGAVRVMKIDELFLAAKMLAGKHIHLEHNRLMIITNGGGAGVMAADRAAEMHVTLPDLSEECIEKLNKVLPAQWSHQNPVDIIGDANPKRYHDALEICSKEKVDALLAILVPVAMAQPLKVAKQLIADAKKHQKLLLACWMGEKQVKSSWKLFQENHIPYFDTPERAVAAFSFLAQYQQHQAWLKQEPAPIVHQQLPQIETAKQIINQALTEKRETLTTVESKKILQAFFIETFLPIEVANAEEAVKAAQQVGYPVVMKINSPDISHKQDVNGVALNLSDANKVRDCFNRMIEDAKRLRKDAKILGVTIEPMLNKPHDRELMIGVMHDKVFGPVISFGTGGSMVEVYRDRSLALPPINRFIANQMIDRTLIAKALGEFRGKPAVAMDKIIDVLLRISEMVCLLPQIKELDINPLLANENRAVAVDARIIIQPYLSLNQYDHLAIKI